MNEENAQTHPPLPSMAAPQLSGPRFDPEPVLAEARIIRTTPELAAFLQEVRSARIIGIDTESAGFHRYSTDISLIQVATTTTCALLDPLALKDFTPLQRFAEDARRQWVFHGSDYDLKQLAMYANVHPRQIFDTRIAAELLGLATLSLGGLSESLLGYPLDKKLQRCDWARRPLTPEMMRYGLLDAVCLPPIRQRLRQRLIRRGRMAWAEEEFARVLQHDYPANPEADPRAFMIKGSRNMAPRNLVVLREVHALREELAKRRDRPPFMVLPNDALLEIARHIPQSRAGLSVIRGVGQFFLQRHGDQLLAVVRRAMQLPLDTLPPNEPDAPRMRSLTGWEGELLQTLRQTRNDVATREGLDPTFLANNHMLEALVRQRPNTPDEMAECGLSQWRVGLLFQGMSTALLRLPPEPPQAKGKRRRRRGGRRRTPAPRPT